MVWCCCFSPDGKKILSGSEDGFLKLWLASDGALQQTLSGHGADVSSCCFSPDGKTILSGSYDGFLKLWLASDGAWQQTLSGHGDVVRCCCFSPDGKKILSGSDNGTLKLWLASDGALQQTLSGHGAGVWCCCFSPDGRKILSGSSDGTLKLLFATDGSISRTDQQTVDIDMQHVEVTSRDIVNKYHILQAAQLPRLSPYLEYGVDIVSLDNPFGKFMAQLVISTAVGHRESYRSALYCDPPQLDIVGVRSVVNPRLQHLYQAKLGLLEGKRRPGPCSPIAALSHLKVPVNMHDFDLNEHFMFHGAAPSTLEKICKGGFNPQRGGEATGKLFGTAAYFAANSSKSDDYTEERTNPLARSARRTIIVSRVALGESFRALRSMKDATKPPDNSDGMDFDSVWADTSSNGGCVDHIEVMVYSEGQALPVALVDYRHADDCACAFCRRRP
ncbi:unnamed protein product [Prorocentrum cordatum]|uniref:PARP catalytic domain-containing protein n=1 Tax=Prorocentrum cordatum TaxID=2364126 RepID=A0ABN9SKA0_9DINO|nr:unnamed protein product [Polarella glacialis]